MSMRWLHRLRVWLLPLTRTIAQRRVDAVDRTLAALRAEIAALPPHERAARMPEVQTLIAAQARARNELSDALDDRAER
jgi:hypothetical protein